MATYEYSLTEPPTDEREKELWLQHGAGFIIFQDARQYAIDEIPANYDDEQRSIALKAIDDAIYGLMMIIEGVSGCLKNEKFMLSIETKVKLQAINKNELELVEELDLAQGDGMCMGYHGWREDDYGRVRPAIKNKAKD